LQAYVATDLLRSPNERSAIGKSHRQVRKKVAQGEPWGRFGIEIPSPGRGDRSMAHIHQAPCPNHFFPPKVVPTSLLTTSNPTSTPTWTESSRNLKGTALVINGTRNHVHLLLVQPTDSSIANLARDLKSNSSMGSREMAESRSLRPGKPVMELLPLASRTKDLSRATLASG
jgi:hypothetical protein